MTVNSSYRAGPTKIMDVEIFYYEEQCFYEDEERCEEYVEVEKDLECQLSVHVWAAEKADLVHRMLFTALDICQIGLA